MYIEVNNTKLFFDVSGPKLRLIDGEVREVPTLLLLHGGPGFDHFGMKGELLPLAEHFQLVWIDHRGNGRSEGSDPAQWNLEQWADDVAAFCQALEIHKPVVFGQSFGGHVAQMFGIRHPTLPAKLIISSIAAKWNLELCIQRFTERGGPEIGRAARNMWGRMHDQDIEDYFRLCHHIYNVGPPSHKTPTPYKTDVMRHYLQPGGQFQSIDMHAGLANITCPTLVLAGTQDPVIPWELSRNMADALVNAKVTYVQMDHCGHGIWRDDGPAGRKVIADFVLGA